MPDSGRSRLRSLTDLRPLRSGALVVAAFASLALAAPAGAQVGDQYVPPTVTTAPVVPIDREGTPPPVTPPTVTTTPRDAVVDPGDIADDGGDGTPSGPGTGPGTGGGTRGGTGGGGASGGARAVQGRPIVFATFGLIPRALRRDVDRALDEGGLRYVFVDIDREDLEEFLTSDLAKRIAGSDDPRAIGLATARVLAGRGPDAEAIRDALFPNAPDDEELLPVIAAVLAHGPKESVTHRRFLHGLGIGFRRADVPGVFVERRDAKPSRIAEFRRRRVPTVANIDTAEGRQRLVDLLTRRISGADALDPASFVGDEGSSSTGPVLAGVLGLLAIVMLSSTAIVRRVRRD